MSQQNVNYELESNANAHLVTIKTTHTVDTQEGPFYIDGSSGAYTITLGDGRYPGQLIFFNCTVAGNNVSLSVTKHLTSNPEVFTLNAINESILLQWNGVEWQTVVANGATT